MAGEYFRWLARDEKPREKRELTPKEKWKNWWDYHKWHVVIAIVAVLFLASFVSDYMEARMDQPDYQIAYVCSDSYLSEDAVAALENALAEMGEDLNGDGQVLIRVNQYPVNAELVGYTGQVQLAMDLAEYQSFIFLMMDPEFLHRESAALAYPDGTIPEDGAEYSQAMCYSWSSCPVLRSLDLGEYAQQFSGLYVGRRACKNEQDCKNYAENAAFWQKLTAGAE